MKRVEELRGPPVDSYDKLIAWLSEMAESDNVHLDTSVFVKQLTTVCRNENSTSNGLSNLAAGGSDRGSSSSTGLTAGARRSATLRQNSASCESRASSSDTHHFSTGRSTYSRLVFSSCESRASSSDTHHFSTGRSTYSRLVFSSCESRASSSDTHHFSTGRSTYSRLVFSSVGALMNAGAASSAMLQDEDHSEGVQNVIRLPNKAQWSALFIVLPGSSYLVPAPCFCPSFYLCQFFHCFFSFLKTFLFLQPSSLVPLP